MKRLICGGLLSVLALACEEKKGDAPAPAPKPAAQPAAAPEPPVQVAVTPEEEKQFAAEAAEKITADNAEQAADSLLAEIEAELAVE